MQFTYGEKQRADGVAKCLRANGFTVKCEKQALLYKVTVDCPKDDEQTCKGIVTGFIYAYDRYIDA
jgi:hypothetical protein